MASSPRQDSYSSTFFIWVIYYDILERHLQYTCFLDVACSSTKLCYNLTTSILYALQKSTLGIFNILPFWVIITFPLPFEPEYKYFIKSLYFSNKQLQSGYIESIKLVCFIPFSFQVVSKFPFTDYVYSDRHMNPGGALKVWRRPSFF